MNNKICSQCKVEKSFSEFKPQNGKCHPCLKQYKAEFYMKNREKYNKASKERYEKIKGTDEFKEKKREYSLVYRKREVYKTYKNNYQGGENYKNWRKTYRKTRLSTDPKYKLSARIGSSICDSLKGRKNGRKWEDLVGYTAENLKNHLESLWEPWMTWQNHGVYDPRGPKTWQIDHIVPASLFNYKEPEDEEFKLCWSLNNLQPKNSRDNIVKKNNYIG